MNIQEILPLEVENKNFSYNDTKEGDAIVVFSKKRVLEIAQSYSEKGIKASIIYGDLPPEVRKMQYAGIPRIRKLKY